jgi:hypothetical protein
MTTLLDVPFSVARQTRAGWAAWGNEVSNAAMDAI